MIGGRPLHGMFGQQVGAADISSTSLVGYWRFNEGTGTAAASETGDHAGTLVGTPTWATGKSGTGISLNGTSQCCTVTRTAALDITTNTVTLMAWINATTTASTRRIICLPMHETGGSEKYSLFVSAGTLQFLTGNTGSDIKSTSFTTTGSWVHVCGVYNGTNMNIFINGSSVGSPVSKTANMLAWENGTLSIGRYGPTYGQYFSGTIDDVRIYSRAVSDAEVTQVYNLG